MKARAEKIKYQMTGCTITTACPHGVTLGGSTRLMVGSGFCKGSCPCFVSVNEKKRVVMCAFKMMEEMEAKVKREEGSV